MKHQEFLDLKDVTSKPGWKVFQTLLQAEFDRHYKKLRTVSRETLGETQKYLDGIEKAMKLADQEIDSYEPEPERQPE